MIIQYMDTFFLPRQVSWYKDGLKVHPTERHSPEGHGTLVMLRIRRVQAKDFGNYSCQAENSQGVSRDHIELTGKLKVKFEKYYIEFSPSRPLFHKTVN